MDVEKNMQKNGGTPREKQHLMDNSDSKTRSSGGKVPEVELKG